MFEVLLALLIGLIIGKLGHASQWVKRLAALLTAWGIPALLFCMGLGLGADPKVMQSLPQLGGRALLLAISSVCGAFLLCLPLARRLKLRQDTPEDSR